MENERRVIRSDVSSLIQNGVQSDEAHQGEKLQNT